MEQTVSSLQHSLTPPKPLTVTLATAKQLTGLGFTTLWALIKSKKLEVIRVGRRTLITYRSLESLMSPDKPLGM